MTRLFTLLVINSSDCVINTAEMITKSTFENENRHRESVEHFFLYSWGGETPLYRRQAASGDGVAALWPYVSQA